MTKILKEELMKESGKYIDLPVDNYASPAPHSVGRGTPIKEIKKIMDEFRFRHVPVVHDKIPVGLVSQRDLAVVLNLELDREITAEDIMSAHPYCVRSGTRLVDVALDMSSKKIGSALIVDDSEELVGIFTATDGLNALIEVIRDEVDS